MNSAIRIPQSAIKGLVVIAASAGGIAPLTRLVSRLPGDLPVAVLVVQHLGADRPTRLPEYLNSHTALAVSLAASGMSIEAGHVYVAEPGSHLRVGDGRLVLDQGDRLHHVRPAADLLFQSAAKWFGREVIGVVLSGTGRDGTEGCREIKARGGITMAQDKESARYFAMPKNAIDAGVIDHVLPPDEIAEKIVELVRWIED